MEKTTDFSALLQPQTDPDHSNSEAIQVCQARMAHALERLETLVAPETADRVAKMRQDLAGFNVRISMVGQVKAGKTALTNSLISRPGLLPSDVNPWTSVVTSIHLNTKQPRGKDAVFTFFTSDEWKKMVDLGGHLGEMAVRANHEEEFGAMRSQIETMQARTKARLGQNFNMLLDGYHSFLGFSPELVKKYVCLGDEESTQEGRYADITKSAELYIANEDYSLPTVICDTPGVNDPFLLREAVTLDNLSDTDICVVVLSAHQAFTSVDIALLRILMALKHEQLVLFVNRVDELQDPDRQIAEIDKYIRELLVEQNLSSDLPIVFGSASWAEAAATGTSTEAFQDSEIALFDFHQARQERLASVEPIDGAKTQSGTSLNTMSKLSDLSGLHELQTILRDKSAFSVGRPFLERLRVRALDISEQSLLYFDEVSKTHSTVRGDLDYDGFFDELDTILKEASDACTKITRDLSQKVLLMMSGAFRDFMHREKASLKDHLTLNNDVSSWQPDTDRLRRELNLAHDEFVEHAPAKVGRIFDTIAGQIEVIYALVLDKDDDIFAVRSPKVTEPKTPVSLMRTMAIDMSTGWFSGWFNSRFNKATYVKKFEELCVAEMKTTLKDMQDTYVISYEKQFRTQLYLYLSEHMETLHRLCGLGREDHRADVIRKLGLDTEVRGRVAELEAVIKDLQQLFKRPSATTKTISRSVA